VWTFAYEDSGRLETITDPLLRQTTLRYDAGNRIIRYELPGGVTVGVDNDASGNITAVTPPGRPTHRFSHDEVDLVKGYAPPSTAPATDTTSYDHDEDHALETVVRPGGEIVHLDYDAGGRPFRLTHARDRVTWSYGGGTGLLSSAIADSGVSLAYAFNGSLPTGETWQYPGGIQIPITVDYDDDMRLTRENVGSDSVGFSYDRDNLLVRAGPEKLTRNASNGSLRRIDVGALISEYSYNGAGELIALETRTTGGQVLYAEGLTRDLLGRVTQRRDSTWTGSAFQVRSEVYGYDAAGRLETVDRNGTRIATYGYDGNGNRTSFTGATSADTATATYDDQDRMIRYKDTAYTYAASGELKWRADGPDTTRYEYDALGALRRVTLSSGARISYEIDARGRRVGRGEPAQPRRRWVYQGGNLLVAEADSLGVASRRFIYGSRRNAPDLMKQGATLYRLVTDHVGSVVAVIDANTGALVARSSYDVWGSKEEDTQPGLVPLGFAGGLTEESTGLVRFGARDYQPATGRWVSKDPIGFVAADPNLYRYAMGDPGTLVDPDGLATVSIGAEGSISTPTGWGGGGGMFLNFGWDPCLGLSFSVTGTVGGGVSPGLGFGFGVTGHSSNAKDVNDLLGTFYQAGVGVQGGDLPKWSPFVGAFSSPDGKVQGGSISIGVGPGKGITTPYAGASTTSAIVQFSNTRGFGAGVTDTGTIYGD